MTHFNPIIITGSHVQLESIQEKHREALKSLAEDKKVSTYSPALRLKYDDWFNKALKQDTNKQLAFIVRTISDKTIVGSTRFYEIETDHKRLSIGYTWYTPSVWGTQVNAECKLLLLKYAFETMQMNRVEFFIDVRNERSLAAVKKLGATLEGVMRKHIILDDGYVRDTVVLSIIKDEWEAVAKKLQARLEKFNG